MVTHPMLGSAVCLNDHLHLRTRLLSPPRDEVHIQDLEHRSSFSETLENVYQQSYRANGAASFSLWVAKGSKCTSSGRRRGR